MRRQRGFTLMELMVVIVIVAILAAVAVPLYVNYVKDAQRTEAKGAIGEIISAEQLFFQNTTSPTHTYTTDLAALKTAGLDVLDAEAKWTFVINTADASGFKVTATSKTDAAMTVVYNYTRAGGGTFTP